MCTCVCVYRKGKEQAWLQERYRPRCQWGEMRGGTWKERRGAQEPPVGTVGLGRVEGRAEPGFCPSECPPPCVLCSATTQALGPRPWHTQPARGSSSPKSASPGCLVCPLQGAWRGRRGRKRQALAGLPGPGSSGISLRLKPASPAPSFPPSEETQQ